MVNIAACVLVLPDLRFVLQRRTKDAPTSPGQLGFFGGHIEQGEHNRDAALRELSEETSLNVKTLTFQPIGEWRFPYTIDRGTIDDVAVFHVYKVAIPDDIFDVFEGDGKEVYTRDEITRRRDVARSVRVITQGM